MRTVNRRFSSRAVVSAVVGSLLTTAAVSGAEAAPNVRLSPASAAVAGSDWEDYILAPKSEIVRPVDAEAVGDVANPAGLTGGTGKTTITTAPGAKPSSVILDFGQEIAGTPLVDVSGVSGETSLGVTTHESRTFAQTGTGYSYSSAASDIGSTTLTVDSTGSFSVGAKLVIDATGAAQEGTVTAVDDRAKTLTVTPALTSPVPADALVITFDAELATDEDPNLSGGGGTDVLLPDEPGLVEAGYHGGFRFVTVTLRSPGTVDLSSLRVRFQGFRAQADDYKGTFLSSDDELNRMWYSGAYTLQTNLKPAGLNGLPDARIYDGAKRDRSIWTGDLLVQIPTALSTLGDVGAEYARSTLDVLVDKQKANGEIPGSPDFLKSSGVEGSPLYYSVNYSGYGARAIIDYYRYTGDEGYAADKLPALRKAVAYNQTFVNENNLIVSNDRDYWQANQTGEVTKYSIDYYILLKEMAWYERQVGSVERAREYDATADSIATAVKTRLWNDDLGAFGQSSDHPGVLVEDANSLALEHGLVPDGREDDVRAALKTLWTPYGATMGPGLADPTNHTIEPFANGMETAGRFAVGDAAGAIDLMRRTYGTMIDKKSPLYTGTFWEFKNSDGGVNRTTASLSHGWATAPTVQLTQEVLGVKPVDAGYATWDISPQFGSLSWAQGTVPTKAGDIDVAWNVAGPNAYTLTAKAPARTKGTIALPAAADSVVSVNGDVVFANEAGTGLGAQRDGDVVTLTVPGGSYDVTVSEPLTATSAPTITGTAKVGRVLSATPGAWSADGLSFTYQWLRDGQPIAGATAATYRAVGVDHRARLSVRVTASKAGAGTGQSTSAATAKVRKATSKTAVAVNRTSLKPGQRLTVRVAVSAPGVVPSGKVDIYYRGKRQKTLSLRNGKTPVVAFRPAVSGRHTVKVRYRGEKGIGASSTSIRVRIR